MAEVGQLHLIVADLERSIRFWSALGWQSHRIHPLAVVFDAGSVGVVLNTSAFARGWDPAFRERGAGDIVVDVDVPTREAVDETVAVLIAAGGVESVRPYDAFFGCRYAVVVDPDGHRVGLKSPQDRALGYPPPV